MAERETDPDGLPLIAYLAEDLPRQAIRPAPRTRAWMDETPDALAYRCLPLVMANQNGWEVLCNTTIEAVWDGGAAPDALRILSGDRPEARIFSHFGSGILTFEIAVILRTAPGHDLWVTGPVNRPKDGAQGLSALIEADWMPFTFTMNWKFTRPGLVVRFEEGEPVCHFLPVARDTVERARPEVQPIDRAPELRREYASAKIRRMGPRVARTRQPGLAPAEAYDFQRWYQRGEWPGGSGKVAGHRTRLDVRPFPGLAAPGSAGAADPEDE